MLLLYMSQSAETNTRGCQDPEECLSALNDAFTSGPELQGENVNTLYRVRRSCTSAIINAYYSSSEATLLGQARDLMNPKIIKRVEEIVKTIMEKYDHFMSWPGRI